MRQPIYFAVLLLWGCRAPTAATGALMNVAIGTAAAGASRAMGGCYAACPTGTTCNTKTGLCDALPCHGRCSVNEHCDASGLFDRCLPGREGGPEIEIGRNPFEPRTATPEKSPGTPSGKTEGPSP